MFGHHGNNDDKQAEPAVHEELHEHHDQPAETANQVVHPGGDQPEEPATVAAELASDATEPVTAPPAADDSAGPQDTDTFDAGATDSPASDDQPWQHPGAPIDDHGDHQADEAEEPLKDEAPEPISDVIYPAGLPKAPTFSPAGSNPAPAGDDSTPGTHQLIDIKVKALDELAPLIDDLDMPPEEKFRTVMMMIQASDNQDLVEKAYQTAHAIEDEKVRAQALLDVVNEINYFTQPHQDQPEV